MGGSHPTTLKRFARFGQTFEDKSRGFHAAVDKYIMKLNDVVAAIKQNNHKKILVTGPQRSGTTIATEILAQELDYRYVDEKSANTILDILHFVRHATRFVIQGPTLAAYCHLLPMTVVYMIRPINEIIASEIRIKWSCSCEQEELAKCFADKGPISEVKYKIWNTYQKPLLKDFFELEYHSMKDHCLWINKEKRVDFSPKQTKLV